MSSYYLQRKKYKNNSDRKTNQNLTYFKNISDLNHFERLGFGKGERISWFFFLIFVTSEKESEQDENCIKSLKRGKCIPHTEPEEIPLQGRYILDFFPNDSDALHKT